MKFLLNIILNGFAVYISAYILPGVTVEGFFAAIVTSVILGVLNTFIKPILLILTLPITILTVGLFALVINVFMVYIASALVPGFHVDSFVQALLFSILLSLVGSVLQAFSK